MKRDILGEIAESINRHRASASNLLALGGVTPPDNERDWLKFSLNQSLRAQGFGKPLEWKPMTAEELAAE